MEETGGVASLEKYEIPADYESIFQKRVLIITGVGRSGTTILGKVIGSLKPAYYLFEPAIMKLLPFLIVFNELNERIYSLSIQSLLFEDYFLQVIHGRSLNFNVRDDSYVGNYLSQSEIECSWNDLARRQDVVDYLADKRPWFVIKIPEFQPLYSVAQRIFSQPRFIHIIRNGNDVVSSSVKRGWFADRYMNTAIIDWVKRRGEGQDCNIPWYLDAESERHFPHWNKITRTASIWRSLVESGMDFCAENLESSIQLKYEDFVRSPMPFVTQFEQAFGLKSTEITRRHLNSIKSRKPNQYPSIQKDVEKPERDKFMSLMERLGYLE